VAFLEFMQTDSQEKVVSVVIPTLNRCEFLHRCIGSVFNQGYAKLEVLVVDDGSTDGTQALIDSLKIQHPEIEYFRNFRRQGPAGARNSGIMKSSGVYIAFLDSDDEWLPGRLAETVRILNTHPVVDVVFGNFGVVEHSSGRHLYDFFDQKELLHSLSCERISLGAKIIKGDLFPALIQEGFFHLGGAVIRKAVLNGLLLDETVRFAEDRDFAIQLARGRGAVFAFRESPVFIRYEHGHSLMKSGGTRNIEILKAHLQLYAKYGHVYQLSGYEKGLLRHLTCKRLLNLSYLYRHQGKYVPAMSACLGSLSHGLTMAQLKEILKIFGSIFLHRDRRDRLAP
jgi:glycosyltransferase involved in cell wall biosynthesis